MVSTYFINENTDLRNYLKMRHLSDAQVYKLVSNKAITNEISALNLETKLKKGNYIYINYSLLEDNDAQESYEYENEINLNVLYEDSEIIAIDKMDNILIHSDGNTQKTLLNAVVYYLKSKGDDSYIRTLHRIDFETRGVCLFAKNILSYQEIDFQITTNNITRKYIAEVQGIVYTSQELRYFIGRDRHNAKKNIVLPNEKHGKESVTLIRPMKTRNNNTLLDIEIKTGRTHQIRVSLEHIKHPILGDDLYGTKKNNQKLQLISKELSFVLNNRPYKITSEQYL